MKTFAARLKELRITRGLTQEELSKRLDVSKSRISMYENGKREPGFEMLELIADFFNVDMNYLIGSSDTTTDLRHQNVIPLYESDIIDPLIRIYVSLNRDGREKLLDYAKDLYMVEKYRGNSDK